MATFTVTNLNDSGTGSLRDILNQANTTTGVDSIVFQSGLSGTLTLTSGELDITDSVTITGSGITISGNNTARIFYVFNAASELNVTLSGLTLTSGSVVGDGGAVYSNGENLTVVNSVVTGNSATDDGGGIFINDANLTIQNSQITGNTATDEGGGVYFWGENGEVLSVTGGSIATNQANRFGGIAIRSDSTPIAGISVNLQSTAITGNEALTSPGGGLGLYGSNITATVTDSSISGNKAHFNGGGLHADIANSTLTIVDSEIVDNASEAEGGGIYFDATNSDLNIEDSTLSGNTSLGAGSALRFLGYGTVGQGNTFSMKNSDVAENVAENGTIVATFYSGSGNTFDLSDSTIQNNTAEIVSAGIALLDLSTNGGVLGTIDNSVILNNRISDFSVTQGGGVNLGSAEGDAVLNIVDSIVANNNGGAGEVDLYSFIHPITNNKGTINVINSLLENPGTAINGSNTGNSLGLEPNTVTLAIAPTTTVEGGTALVYTFTRTGSSTQALTVNFRYSGTATLGTDYSQTGAASFSNGTGSITFAANATTATITLTPLADPAIEGNETINLEITNGLYLVGDAREATGTLVDDGPTGLPPAAIDFTRKKNKKGEKEQGGNGKDDLTGTGKDDILKGRSGKDTINGKGGKDRIFGDGGNDTLKGAGGNDLMDGGIGNDKVTGGGGDDQLTGGDGDDTLIGQGGRDLIIGGLGTDILSGGGEADTFVFNSLTEGIDTITDFNGDLIDLRGILSAPQYTAVNNFQKFSQYVQFIQVGANTELRVDADGNGAGTVFTTLAVLSNVTATSLSSSNVVVA